MRRWKKPVMLKTQALVMRKPNLLQKNPPMMAKMLKLMHNRLLVICKCIDRNP